MHVFNKFLDLCPQYKILFEICQEVSLVKHTDRQRITVMSLVFALCAKNRGKRETKMRWRRLKFLKCVGKCPLRVNVILKRRFLIKLLSGTYTWNI